MTPRLSARVEGKERIGYAGVGNGIVGILGARGEATR